MAPEATVASGRDQSPLQGTVTTKFVPEQHKQAVEDALVKAGKLLWPFRRFRNKASGA